MLWSVPLRDESVFSRRSGHIPMRRATAIAIKLASVTGQRIGEVCGLTEDELELNEVVCTWTVPGVRSKNESPTGFRSRPWPCSWYVTRFI